MNLKKRRIILVLCLLIFLVVTPIVLLYSNGYRLDSRLHITKTGGLYVSTPVSGSEIFINNQIKKTTNIIQGGLFLQNLKPGKYSVLIAKEGYWPWQKELEIKETMVSEARALMLLRDPDGEVLHREELLPSEIKKYDKIIASIQTINNSVNSATSTAIERFTNYDRQKIWWSPGKNQLWAEWLDSDYQPPYYFSSERVLILDSIYKIKNADFYPGRRDVIIVAVQNGIFALEIDDRGGRILQPIYKGKDPIFDLIEGDSNIYVFDEGILMKIKP